MGITNELFQSERDETPSCQFTTTPNDVTNMDGPVQTLVDAFSAIERFAFFMRSSHHRHPQPIRQAAPSR